MIKKLALIALMTCVPLCSISAKQVESWDESMFKEEKTCDSIDFLASLGTKHSEFYGLEHRSGDDGEILCKGTLQMRGVIKGCVDHFLTRYRNLPSEDGENLDEFFDKVFTYNITITYYNNIKEDAFTSTFIRNDQDPMTVKELENRLHFIDKIAETVCRIGMIKKQKEFSEMVKRFEQLINATSAQTFKGL
jgi:hypothetical protein